MITLYILNHSTSSRSAKAYLTERGLSFEIRNVSQEFLTYEELTHILYLTEEGTEEIITKQAKAYGNLIAEGVDFDELTLKELYTLLHRNRSLLRSPIAVTKDKLVIGFNEENFGVFQPRPLRLKEVGDMLSHLRKTEDTQLGEGEKVREGHLGY